MKAGAYLCVESLSFWCRPGLLNSELLSFSGIPIFFPEPLLWQKSKAVKKIFLSSGISFSLLGWRNLLVKYPFEWQEQPRVRFHHPQESVSDLTLELMEAVGVVGTWQVSTCGRDLKCKGGAKTVSLWHSRSGHEQGTETPKRQGSCPRHVNQVKNVPQSCWTSLSPGGTPQFLDSKSSCWSLLKPGDRKECCESHPFQASPEGSFLLKLPPCNKGIEGCKGLPWNAVG